MLRPPKYESQLNDRQALWFAVYVRYKREKLIYQRLVDKGVKTYLPLQTFTRHYTRKVKVVELPLISCYIFTHITKKEYLSVLQTPDIVDFIRFSGRMIPIPEVEMTLLQRVVGEKVDLEIAPVSYQTGDEVEIIGGDLTGIKGILIDQENKKNFLIELNHIGYSLRMQVDPLMLKRVRKAAAILA